MTLTVSVSQEVQQALEASAAVHGHSTSAEAADRLRESLGLPEHGTFEGVDRAEKPLGQALWELGRRLEITDDEVDAINSLRDRDQT